MIRKRLHYAAMLFCPLVCGCMSQFNEVHYLSSNQRNSDGTPVNYYKLTVTGGTFLSSSRYISGYYDDKALDEYFNEIEQPADAALVPPPVNPSDGIQVGAANTQSPPPTGATLSTTSNSASPPAAATPTSSAAAPGIKADYGVSPLGSAPSNRSLMLILSSNSDAIANNISAFATTGAITTDLTQLLAPRQSAADGQRQAEAAALDESISQMLDTLGTTPSTGDAEATMLAVTNRLAAYLGHPSPFKTLKDANAWVIQQGTLPLRKD